MTERNPYEPYTGTKPSVVFNSLGSNLTFDGDYYTLADIGAVATTHDLLSQSGYGAGFHCIGNPAARDLVYAPCRLSGGLAFYAYRGTKSHSSAIVA